MTKKQYLEIGKLLDSGKKKDRLLGAKMLNESKLTGFKPFNFLLAKKIQYEDYLSRKIRVKLTKAEGITEKQSVKDEGREEARDLMNKLYPNVVEVTDTKFGDFNFGKILKDPSIFTAEEHQYMLDEFSGIIIQKMSTWGFGFLKDCKIDLKPKK